MIIRISRYHWPVTKCEMPTVSFVSAGSCPPKSLKTFSKTGTMKATRASSTSTANEMITPG